jgi:hypothetical protein
MGKGNEITTEMEKAFLALSPEERGAVISHGVALRLSHLRKRLFLAESKIRHFEDQYKVTLDQLEGHGLANDAGFEMHEDYVMWSHWVEVADKAKKDIIAMEKIAQQGLQLGESAHVGS